MNIDLIGSVELTASAAIVVAALSIGFGLNPATRLRAGFGLSLWFTLVVILAATHALYYEHGLGTIGHRGRASHRGPLLRSRACTVVA
jgi:hypothetical protein